MRNWSVKSTKRFVQLWIILNTLILASTITGWISISDFGFLVVIPFGITSSAIVLKNCTIITAAIKKFNSVIKKRKEAW